MKLLEPEWISYRNSAIPEGCPVDSIDRIAAGVLCGRVGAICADHESTGSWNRGGSATPQDLTLTAKLDAEMREFKGGVERVET